jgi:TolA-binding protein
MSTEVSSAQTGLIGENLNMQTTEEPAMSALPVNLRDVIFQDIQDNQLTVSENLSVIEAERQTWDSCLGLATVEETCLDDSIQGWRVMVSDGSEYWIYHTNNSGSSIRLNTTASSLDAMPTFIPRVQEGDLHNEETVLQSIVSTEAGLEEKSVLFRDGPFFGPSIGHFQFRDGELLEGTADSVSQNQIQQISQLMAQSNFCHFDGLQYQTSSESFNNPWTKLTSNCATVEIFGSNVESLPLGLQNVIQTWDDLLQQSSSSWAENAPQERKPASQTIPLTRAEHLFQEAEAAQEMRSYEQAAYLYRKVIYLEPSNAAAHRNLGLALLSQTQIYEAEVAFREAIHLDPNDAEAHLGLGVLLFFFNRWTEAITVFQNALSLDPNSAEAPTMQFFLDRALLAQNQYGWLEPFFCKPSH